ncbi:hypothetical protein [Thioalkalivibrio sp. ALJ8]|uniref:hypothetical protein n=1 Tax=Thioalkalivibrio sp. ALJ8 TaxID=1158757 RepID=UPI00035C27CF|nr:hypothetical protein [Thioalkalivibrio sp. ALJ8]
MARPGGSIRLISRPGVPQASGAITLAPCGQRQDPGALVLREGYGGGPQPGDAVRLMPCLGGLPLGDAPDPAPDYPATFRGPAPVVGLPYAGRHARRPRPHSAPGWTMPPPFPRHTDAQYSAGTPRRVHTGSLWGRLPQRPRATGVPWDARLRDRSRHQSGRWGDVPPRRDLTAAPWLDRLTPHSPHTDTPHAEPPHKRRHTGAGWGSTHPLARLLEALHREPPHKRQHTRFPWGDVWGITFFIRPEPPDPEPPDPDPEPCYVPPEGDAVALVLDRPWESMPGDAVQLHLLCPGEEPAPPALTIPTLKVYTMINDIHVARLSDGLEIAAAQLQLGLDVEAHTWSFSGTLVGADAMDAVKPGSGGEPVTLVVTINGYTWHVLVEEWSETREFAQRGVQVRGRGLSSLLTRPYQQPVSGQITAPTNVQQAFDALLPVDSGFSIQWDSDLDDWMLPEGAWSWGDDTPLGIIHEAATEVGMIVVPDRAARTLRFRARYPVLPWQYEGAEPALTVPDAAILRLTRQQPITTQANAVYVHGGSTGGRLVQVTRDGSAGDRLASTQSSDLITDIDGARLLGGRILAGEHQQPSVRSITLPLGGDFPLPTLADLVQLEIDNDPERATLRSVQIEARLTDLTVQVRQTLGFGEEPDNAWARFRRLMPYDPLLIGEVVATHSDNTVTVELVGGGTQRVRGQATTGDNVYIRAGRIEGEAPDLPTDSISV